MYTGTQLTVANINAAISKYVSDNALTGSLANAAATRIASTIHADAQKYAADKIIFLRRMLLKLMRILIKSLRSLGLSLILVWRITFRLALGKLLILG